MHGELAYLFRHALLRDAAYDLQPPAERQALHAIAHEIIEALFAGNDLLLDTAAIELARHAGLAGMGARECGWLQRAARHSAASWRGEEAADLYLRVSAHTHADAATRSLALSSAGKCMLDIGRLQPAREVLEQALASAPTESESVQALRPLAFAARNLGDSEFALVCAEELLALTEKGGGAEDRALALDAMATALTALERNDEALQYAERACQMAGETRNSRVLGGMLANHGVLLSRLGKRKEAIQRTREALDHLTTTSDRRAVAATRRNLGDFLRAAGKPGAREECELALKEMRELGDRRGEGIALLTLGGLEKDEGRPEIALPLLTTAHELLLESGDGRAAAVALSNASSAALDARDFENCEQLATRALQLARDSRSVRAVAMALSVLADLAKERGQWLPAAQLYEQAAHAFDEFGNRTSRAWQLGERAVMLHKAGDAGASAAWEAALNALQSDAPDDVDYYAKRLAT